MLILPPTFAVKLCYRHLSYCLKISGFYQMILRTVKYVLEFRKNLISMSSLQTDQLYFVDKCWKMCRHFILYIYIWFQNIRPCHFKHYSVDYCCRCCCIANKSTVLLQQQSTYVTAYYIFCPCINFIYTLAKNYFFCVKYLEFINQIFWDSATDVSLSKVKIKQLK
jgi:hypothetical protein